MKRFWRQLVEHNGPFVARLLRQLAHQVELAAPGPPHLSFVLWSQTEGVTMSDISVLDTAGTLNGTVAFLDAEGNPTTADDVPVWSSSDETIASVAAAADGLSAVVTVLGPVGATVIAVDSTRSSDQADVHAQATLTVTASEEVSGEVTLSPAV
jgi:hypothetical protein